MLHVTNGDCAAQTLLEAGAPGEVLPWRDVLHEGPVPAGQDDAALRQTRARFLSHCGWGEEKVIHASLMGRDLALEHAEPDEEIVLWFEHDLYDQLQLIQVLDRLARLGPRPGTVSIICIDRHPEVENFHGLGQLSADALKALFPARVDVAKDAFELAGKAWTAFRSPDPTGLAELASSPTPALPFLAAALRRMLEEYPSVRRGLSRTETAVLTELSTGDQPFRTLFPAVMQREEAPFLGDTTLLRSLSLLAVCPQRLITVTPRPKSNEEEPEYANWTFGITPVGRDVLAGTSDHVRLNGIDRWLGGVHLKGEDAAFRWDEEARTVVAKGIHERA